MSQPHSRRGATRRHFLNHLATSAVALPAMNLLGGFSAHASMFRRATKSCIVLWMGGGPSQLDTWDPKPGSSNVGEFAPISTSVPGIQISEHLPKLAQQMAHLNIIRSLNSNEGNHERGTYKMHTGHIPNPTVDHPGYGSVVARELGQGDQATLPDCVAINGTRFDAGFLGMAYAPFEVDGARGRIQNLRLPRGVDSLRARRRKAILEQAESQFIAQRRGAAAKDHQVVYGRTYRLMTSPQTRAFSIADESSATREAYGAQTSFGAGCLMARKLVEQGVKFVEVGLGGWDNHNNIFSTLRDNRLPTLDRGMSALIVDLDRRGLLDSTLVVWMGDFGRTPRINANAGRDHWPRSWSVVMAGAGLAGGLVVGQTDADGVEVVDRPVAVPDIMATMLQAMDIPVDLEYTTPLGRPMKIVGEGGAPVEELF